MMKEKEEQHLEWLQQHQTTEPHLGLERVRRLLALRGNPHLQVSVIHVAGTNGKDQQLRIYVSFCKQRSYVLERLHHLI